MEDVDIINKKYSDYDNTSLYEFIKKDIACWRDDFFLIKLGFYSALLYRISRYFSLHNLKLFAGIFQFVSHVITGCEISHNAVIGPGLKILHCTGVSIGPYVRIGENSIFCQGSGIIPLGEIGITEPTIGDNLWAGPGCKIMGKIFIGDKVWIGPNTVVIKDVESDKVVFGFPGRAMPKDSYFMVKNK